MPTKCIIIRKLGLQPYEPILFEMRRFTDQRNVDSIDEIWLVQHPQIFTQGQAGKPEHLLEPGSIPVFYSDRGGQITFHGPGQQIMYIMIDLRRRLLTARDLVALLEQVVIMTLMHFAISGNTRNNARGVYVGANKICSIGLRIYKGCSLHGLALNVAMDLSPFLRINPCGYIGLQMTQMSDLFPEICIENVGLVLIEKCLQLLNATSISV